MYYFHKIGGFAIFSQRLRKGHQEFRRMKIENFLWEKVKLEKFPVSAEIVFGNRGKSETEGNKYIIASGGWTPLIIPG